MCDSNVISFPALLTSLSPIFTAHPSKEIQIKATMLMDNRVARLLILYISISFFFLQTEPNIFPFSNLFTSMAKLFIVIAFLLFNLSFARTPLTQPENDITYPKPESDANPTLNQLDKESQHVQDLPEPKAKRVNAVPLTFVQLRPINRHFRMRSRHPFRLCHHHNHHHAHNLNPRTHLDQIPYGKDMIHSSGENSDFENVMVHEDMPELPGEWISFLHHNHHHHDDDDDDDQKMSKFLIKRGNHNKFAKLKLKRQFYDPLDDEEDEDEDEDDKISAMQHEDHHTFNKKKLKKHFHNHHEEEEQEAEQENEAHKEEKKTGGFMKRIRKFLDPYLD